MIILSAQVERQREKSERLRARLGIESLFGNRVHFWYKFREMARFSTQDEPVRVINMCHVHLGVFISEKFIMLQLCCWSRSSGSAKSLSGSAPASASNGWSSFASFRHVKLGRPRYTYSWGHKTLALHRVKGASDFFFLFTTFKSRVE